MDKQSILPKNKTSNQKPEENCRSLDIEQFDAIGENLDYLKSAMATIGLIDEEYFTERKPQYVAICFILERMKEQIKELEDKLLRQLSSRSKFDNS